MSDQTHALSQLLQNHLAATGKSQGDLARESGLSRSRINQLIQQPSGHLPRIETIEKLSRGLALPVSTVKEAALASTGISTETSYRSRRIEALAGRLTDLRVIDASIYTSSYAVMLGRFEQLKCYFVMLSNSVG